jgi:hypothetical protein
VARPQSLQSLTPSSNVSGSSVSRIPTRLPHNTPYVSGSNAFYPNSLSSWPYREFPRTTIWPSAVSALWLSLAKSAAALAAPGDQRLGWAWPLFSVHGPLSISILSASVLRGFPPHLLWVNSEQYPMAYLLGCDKHKDKTYSGVGQFFFGVPGSILGLIQLFGEANVVF